MRLRIETPGGGRHVRAATRLAALVLAATAAALMPASALASPQNHLTPIVDCVDVASDGSITAHFGYDNSWTNQVNVPAGKNPPGQQNWFLPSPADRGQPSQFSPGTASDVFTVTFTPTASSPTLEWRLGDAADVYNSAVASASSARCTPVPAMGVDSAWPAILAAVGVAVVLRARRSRTRGAV
jgi:hypothetical protein